MFTIRSLNTKAKSDGRETHARQKSHKTSIETVEARTSDGPFPSKNVRFRSALQLL